MALPDLDTSVGHSFGLEIDGVVIKQITEVSGLKLEQDVIELKQNSDDGKYTLTRGLTSDTSFEKWIKDSRFGKMPNARKGGAIIVFDYEGSPIKRYKMTNAWPKSLEIGTLKAGDTSVLTEKLVITYEELDVE
jgi:phage tail-like protein